MLLQKCFYIVRGASLKVAEFFIVLIQSNYNNYNLIDTNILLVSIFICEY